MTILENIFLNLWIENQLLQVFSNVYSFVSYQVGAKSTVADDLNFLNKFFKVFN